MVNLQNHGQPGQEKLPMNNAIKSPGYCPQKQVPGIDGQQNQPYGLAQTALPGLDPTKSLAQDLQAAQP